MVVNRTRHPMGCRVPACLGGLRALPISLHPGHSESPLLGEISLQGVWGTLLEDQETMTDASVICLQHQCRETDGDAISPKILREFQAVLGLRGAWCGQKETCWKLCNTFCLRKSQDELLRTRGHFSLL